MTRALGFRAFGELRRVPPCRAGALAPFRRGPPAKASPLRPLLQGATGSLLPLPPCCRGAGVQGEGSGGTPAPQALEEAGAQEAAAREIASRGARVVLALAARDECRHALRGPLALLPRTVPSRQKSTCPDTV